MRLASLFTVLALAVASQAHAADPLLALPDRDASAAQKGESTYYDVTDTLELGELAGYNLQLGYLAHEDFLGESRAEPFPLATGDLDSASLVLYRDGVKVAVTEQVTGIEISGVIEGSGLTLDVDAVDGSGQVVISAYTVSGEAPAALFPDGKVVKFTELELVAPFPVSPSKTGSSGTFSYDAPGRLVLAIHGGDLEDVP